MRLTPKYIWKAEAPARRANERMQERAASWQQELDKMGLLGGLIEVVVWLIRKIRGGKNNGRSQ